MSDTVSRPVSPVTESDNGSVLDMPRLNLGEEVILDNEEPAVHGIETRSLFSDLDTRTIVGSRNNDVECVTSTAQLLDQGHCRVPLRTLQEQLGTWNLVITTVGSIYILIVLSFLWFLWCATEQTPFWKWLVLKGYVQATVTLSSAVLRMVVAIQSSLATSMLASLILETLGSRLRKSAFLSIQRANGGLPFWLLEFQHFWRHSKTILFLTSSLSVSTMLAYLISTALISDFELVSIPGYAANREMSYTILNKTLLGDEPTYSDYHPAGFPVFSEYSETTQSSSNSKVDDTGPALRALLPIQTPSTRERLHSFQGPATLLNSHVVCIQPVIQNLTFETKTVGGNPEYKPVLSGEIAIENPPPSIVFVRSSVDFLGQIPTFNTSHSSPQDGQPGPTRFVSFTYLPLAVTENGESPISMCVAGNNLEYNNDWVDPGRLPILGVRSTSLLNENILLDHFSYVLVNYSGRTPKAGYYDYSNYTIRDNEWKATASPSPIWSSFETPDTYRNNSDNTKLETVSLTYCFPHFAAIDMRISVEGSLPRVEPALSKSNFSSSLDTSTVLRQLGVDGVRRSLEDRGILSLAKSDDWVQANRFQSSSETPYAATGITNTLDGSFGFGMKRNHFTPPFTQQMGMEEYILDYQGRKRNTFYRMGAVGSGNNRNETMIETIQDINFSATWGLCTKCMTGKTDDNTIGIHPALSSIFQDSLKRSGSVATAIQALFTVVNMMQYYDRLSQFDFKDSNILISQFEAVIVPRGKLGILAVTIGLLIHISTVLTITFIFHFRTRVSFVGQSWHAVAQMQDEIVVPVLDRVTLMRDNEVKRWLRNEKSDGDKRFYVGRISIEDGDGSSSIVREGSSIRRRR